MDGAGYRLSAVRYAISDYQAMVRAAGFVQFETCEFTVDLDLAGRVPAVAVLADQSVILALRAATPDPCYH